MLTITTNSFENDVLHADKPVLVDFWAQWCPYCRRIAPAFDKVGEHFHALVRAFDDKGGLWKLLAEMSD